MTKPEHMRESWAYAKALDRLALPRIYEMGQGEAYRWAGERLKGWAMPVERKQKSGLKSDF